MPTPCFWLERTNNAYRFLRRYHHGCNGQAQVEIESGPLVLAEDGAIRVVDWPHDDPRWPTQCSCGRPFTPDDPWICHQHEIYRAADGREYGIHRAMQNDSRRVPPGAMWAVWWIPKGDSWTGPDGLCLSVCLPDGTHWMIDGPSSSDGPGWERSGTPPLITARPSILTRQYHGWLTDGVLSDDLDGRTYS